MIPVLDMVVKYGPSSAGFICLACYGLCCYRHNKKIELEHMLTVFLAGASMPTGILLICSGFIPLILSKMSEASIYISLAGIALLYVSYSGLREKLKP